MATSGVTNITGNLGISPANSTAYTGFGTLSNKGQSATSASVDGRLYASDMATPTPSVLASAISTQAAVTGVVALHQQVRRFRSSQSCSKSSIDPSFEPPIRRSPKIDYSSL